MLKEYRYSDTNVTIHERPDLVVQRSSGEVDLPALEHCFKVVTELAAGANGQLKMLSVTGPDSSVSPEARRRISQIKWPVKCWAVVTPSFSYRTLINMLIRAGQLVGTAKFESRMFATEAEARAWIDQFE